MVAGFSNLLFFIGVVEEDFDPTFSGRAKVRCIGIHPEEQEKVPTEHLPWAIPIDGSYGVVLKTLRVGDWVFGFFIDGREAQHPMLLGKLDGIQLGLPKVSEESAGSGYVPPKSVRNWGRAPLHPYITGENAETTASLRQAVSRKESVKTAIDGITWEEKSIHAPERAINNRVIQSKFGEHFMVLSSAENAKSDGYILLTHSSGSAVQMDEHGSILIKSQGDKQNVTEGWEYNYIGSTQHNFIKDDWTLRVDSGSGKIFINGDLDIECENFNLTSRGKMVLNAGDGIDVIGARVGIASRADNVDIVAYKKLKTLSGDITTMKSIMDFYIESVTTTTLRSALSTSIESGFQLNILSLNDTKITAQKLHMIGTTNIYADSFGTIRFAEGLSLPATPAIPTLEVAAVKKLPDPPGRRLFSGYKTGSTKGQLSKPNIASSTSIVDDVDDEVPL